jgi:hypothetical protein
LYAFRYRKVYKFNSNDVGIERKFPRNVRKVFPKAPNNIGAAVYDRFNRKFYIFKGKLTFLSVEAPLTSKKSKNL